MFRDSTYDFQSTIVCIWCNEPRKISSNYAKMHVVIIRLIASNIFITRALFMMQVG